MRMLSMSVKIPNLKRSPQNILSIRAQDVARIKIITSRTIQTGTSLDDTSFSGLDKATEARSQKIMRLPYSETTSEDDI